MPHPTIYLTHADYTKTTSTEPPKAFCMTDSKQDYCLQYFYKHLGLPEVPTKKDEIAIAVHGAMLEAFHSLGYDYFDITDFCVIFEEPEHPPCVLISTSCRQTIVVHVLCHHRLYVRFLQDSNYATREEILLGQAVVYYRPDDLTPDNMLGLIADVCHQDYNFLAKEPTVMRKKRLYRQFDEYGELELYDPSLYS